MPASEISNRSHELTLAEELTLLALDDKTGRQLDLPFNALAYGLAGAIILDLSLAGRIDTDLQELMVINPAPTGDNLLDYWLSYCQTALEPKSVTFWVRELAVRQEEIQQAAVDRLVQRGILRRQERRLLWVFSLRRYPTIDGTERAEVRTRLSQLILGNDLPTPRDAILLSLIHGCHLSEYLFAGLDLAVHKERLELLASMDLVGREVSAATAASLGMVSRALSEMPVGF
ncbi:MAG: GPP34 family phosphoprotein [Verrucomicrobia bacterium]|nr:GPP34 family phosphoprotein [Verrucomicrobiota bacterium]